MQIQILHSDQSVIEITWVAHVSFEWWTEWLKKFRSSFRICGHRIHPGGLMNFQCFLFCCTKYFSDYANWWIILPILHSSKRYLFAHFCILCKAHYDKTDSAHMCLCLSLSSRKGKGEIRDAISQEIRCVQCTSMTTSRHQLKLVQLIQEMKTFKYG